MVNGWEQIPSILLERYPHLPPALDLPPRIPVANSAFGRDPRSPKKHVSCHPGCDEPAGWEGRSNISWESKGTPP